MYTYTKPKNESALDLRLEELSLVIVSVNNPSFREFHFDREISNFGMFIWAGDVYGGFHVLDNKDKFICPSNIPTHLKKLCKNLLSIPGTETVCIKRYAISVSIGKAFSWHEITSQIISLLARIFLDQRSDGFRLLVSTKEQTYDGDGDFERFLVRNKQIDVCLTSLSELFLEDLFIEDDAGQENLSREPDSLNLLTSKYQDTQ